MSLPRRSNRTGGSGDGSAPGSSQPSASTLRRLMKEWETIQAEIPAYQTESDAAIARAPPSSSSGSAPVDLLELRPWDADGEDLFEWFAVMRGPAGGAYEGGVFELSIQVPAQYPTKPPKMNFKTRIWHPNVSWKSGEICLDILAAQWSPAWTLSSACTAVLALLDAPEPDSPLNVDAG
ncbi:E2 ubiquitin-protein ligase peroxin 4 [Tilletia horrida]|nr:E2 ubiquitin-protein ligase peroxin 4 [Tilletia horrida]